MVFLVAFYISFLRLYKRNKAIYYLFIALLVCNILWSILFLYAFFDTSLLMLSRYYFLFTILTLVMLLGLALWAISRKIKGAIYFFFGEIAYLLALTYTAFVISGNIQNDNFSVFVVPTALLFELVMQSLALAKKIKEIKIDNKKKEILLTENAKYTAIGKAVSNVSHQWKESISRLSSQILYLEALSDTDKERVGGEFLSMLPGINGTISGIKRSVDGFNDFYNDDKNPFSPYEEMEKVLQIEREKHPEKPITIELKGDKNIKLSRGKVVFNNFFILLADHKIEEIRDSKATESYLGIDVADKNGKVDISILSTAKEQLPYEEELQKAFMIFEDRFGDGVWIKV